MRIIIQMTHDDMQFFFSKEAVQANKDIIGSYFTPMNICMPIYRDSLYGDYIVEWVTKENPA